MSTRNRRSAPSREEIRRLVEVDRPSRPGPPRRPAPPQGRTGRGPQLVDDVRAAIPDAPGGPSGRRGSGSGSGG